MHIFTDVSVSSDGQIGIGCVAMVADLDSVPVDIPLKYYFWTNTSSTHCELTTIHRALTEYGQTGVTLYTDCMQAVKLAQRKYAGRKQNEFDRNLNSVMVQHQVRVVKLKGHGCLDYTNPLQQIFKLVDQASRRVLRREVEATKDSHYRLMRIPRQVTETFVETKIVLSLPWEIQEKTD